MCLGVPPSVADIKSADAGKFVIDAHHFRVMTPEIRLLATEMIGMPEHLNVLVQLFQSMLRICRAQRHCLCYLFVHYDTNLNALFCFALEQAVEAVFLK